MKKLINRWLNNYLFNVNCLIDETISLRDAEILKASLYGTEYLKTFNHAVHQLKIAINDLKISIHLKIIEKIT